MESDLVITRADQDRNVELRVGGHALVHLPWSPGTGYGWELAHGDPARLVQVGPPISEPSLDPKPGATETQVFRFRAVGLGITTLEFHHRRPWEKDVPPTESFRVQVRIQG